MTGTDNGTFHNVPFREMDGAGLRGRLDRMMGVMSLIGTFLPCRPRQPMSGFRGKAAVPQKS